ncbi:MAG: response regulator [Candidatus Thorarchaeota archaeon]
MGRKDLIKDLPQEIRILGLTAREAEVVGALLQSATHLGANEIAQRTGIARPYVHDLLRKLVKMNAVTRMKGKTGRSVYGCSIHNLNRFAGVIRTNYEEKLRTIDLLQKSPHPESCVSRVLEILDHSAESFSVYSVLTETGEKNFKELAAITNLSYSRIRQIVSNLTVEGFLNRRRSGTNVLISATNPELAVDQACKIARSGIQTHIEEIQRVLQTLSEDQLDLEVNMSVPRIEIDLDEVREPIDNSAAKVLIVEDHDALRESLIEILAEEGNIAKGASNASDALSLLQSETFDIIVSDIKMPGMDGIEFLRRIRERELPLDFVIITGFGTLGTAQEAIRLGAKDYILKPVDPPSFVRIIADVYKQQNISKLATKKSDRVKKRLHILDQKTRLLNQVIHEMMQIQVSNTDEGKFKASLLIPEQNASSEAIEAKTNSIFSESYPIFQLSVHNLRKEPEALMNLLARISEDGVKAPSRLTTPTLFVSIDTLHDYCDPRDEIEIHETVVALIRRFFHFSGETAGSST